MTSLSLTSLLRASIAAAILAASTVAAHAQFVIQPTTEAESKDTKIYHNFPDGNFASNLSVVSADIAAFYGLVQFSLAGLPLAASEITSATLTLYCYGIGVSGGSSVGGTVSLRPILDAWRENLSDPGPEPVATYNAFFGTTPTLEAGDIIASQEVTAAGYVTWDVTDTVKAWADGSLANYGFFIELTTPGGDVGFADVDSNGAANAPMLTVVPEPGSAVALLGGAAALLGLRRRRSNLFT